MASIIVAPLCAEATGPHVRTPLAMMLFGGLHLCIPLFPVDSRPSLTETISFHSLLNGRDPEAAQELFNGSPLHCNPALEAKTPASYQTLWLGM